MMKFPVRRLVSGYVFRSLPVASALFLAACAASMLSGCGVNPGASAVSPGTALQGQVFGGQQPVSGAALSLYAAGAGGTGTGAQNLLTTPVMTGSDGGFSLTNDYRCPSATTQVYLVARGGNPGLSAGTRNASLVMMAALGDCGALTSSTYTTINEVTTVAAAWTLSQFMVPGALVGASSSNATGLRNAFLDAGNLANVSTGVAPGATLPAGASLRVAKVNTLADALAPCVNSDGTAACSALFAAATSGGVVPTNTMDAALAIVRHPASNVSAVFLAGNPQGPFQPSLALAPPDWTMAITFGACTPACGGLNLPSGVGVDSTGSVWVADYRGGAASKFSPTGVPYSATGYADAALYESYGLTIDGQDNAWITNQETTNGSNSGGGTLTKFSPSGRSLSGSGIFGGGLYFPIADAADASGRIWVADNGSSTASLFANDGSPISPSTGYAAHAIPFGAAVALDANQNAWLAGQGQVVRIAPDGTYSRFACCRGPSGIAIDQTGSVWIADYNASSVVRMLSNGTVAQTTQGTGGIVYPNGIAIDGAGSVWTSNYQGDSISELTGSNTAAPGTAISPSNGFATDANLHSPFGIAIDASGNLWVSNLYGNTLTQILGAAAPIKTPLLGPPVAP